MDTELTKIVKSYFYYYSKNSNSMCYTFLFKIVDKKELIKNKEGYLDLIGEIRKEEVLEKDIISKVDFQRNYLNITSTNHEKVPVLKIDQVVRLRFAPNPNFIPTLGNFRGWILNKHLLDNAKEGSELYLRLDDSDPKNKPATPQAIEGYITMIRDYLPNTILYKCSERLPLYYNKATEYLIKQIFFIEGFSGEKVEEQLKKMILGKSKFQKIYCITDSKKEYCLRVIPLSDQVIRNKSNFCLFPTLIYQTTFDDDDLKITHAARGKDLIEVGRRQVALARLLGLSVPKFLYWGRIKVLSEEGVERISSSKYTQLEKKNKETITENQKTQRMYTYKYFREQGYSPKALERFVLSYGFTENDIIFDLKRLSYFKQLEPENK